VVILLLVELIHHDVLNIYLVVLVGAGDKWKEGARTIIPGTPGQMVCQGGIFGG
jgi:hypothetical protein